MDYDFVRTQRRNDLTTPEPIHIQTSALNGALKPKQIFLLHCQSSAYVHKLALRLHACHEVFYESNAQTTNQHQPEQVADVELGKFHGADVPRTRFRPIVSG